MATPNAPADPDPLPFYTPTDPDLRTSPALLHLVSCIKSAALQAIGSGSSNDVVWLSLSQHQTKFDNVLSILDGVFHLRDTALTPAMRHANLATATVDVARLEAPRAPADLQQRPGAFESAQNDRGSGNVQNARKQTYRQPIKWRLSDGSLRTGGVVGTPPRASPGSTGWTSRQQNTNVVAALPPIKEAAAAQRSALNAAPQALQQDQTDEEWRNLVGNWLGGIPHVPNKVANQLALPDHDAENKTDLRKIRPDHHGSDKNSVNKDDVKSTNPPSDEDSEPDDGPDRTRSEGDLSQGDFSSWTAQKREELRRFGRP